MTWTKYRWRAKRRSLGMLERGSPEWRNRISIKTKEAMANPAIKDLLKKPRAPRSEAAKAAQSAKLAGKMPSNMAFSTNNYGHFQNGNYENSKGTMYFRSKWEANYALYLDFLVKQKQI